GVARAAVDQAGVRRVAAPAGAGDPPAVAAASAVLLDQRVLPEDLAVLAEAGEEALRAVRIDVAGLRIAGQVRPADTADVDVGEEDAEPVRPDNLAGVGVEAHHALASGGAFADGIDDVDVLALHQGRGPAAKLRFPDQVV